jgi:hypothetical protein
MVVVLAVVLSIELSSLGAGGGEGTSGVAADPLFYFVCSAYATRCNRARGRYSTRG